MRTRHLTIALLASVVLAIAAGEASARNLEITNSEAGFRIVWSALRLEIAARNIECPVTLEGTFERRTYTKVASTRVGRVTEAAAGTCGRGRMTILRETLPWETSYSSFTGTLPTITSIRLNLIGMAFRLNIEGVECLARTTAARPFRGTANVTAGEIRTFEAESGAGIETSGGFFCGFGGEAHFAGSGTATVRAETIRIRLI